jgi:CheY-like chemotaxis protein/anti-sigma regulatory factor (Ser/Thr protein kinase)
VYVNGDSTRLSQVLQNLLVNAAKYTPEGGRITLRVSTSGNFVDLVVSDNGRGIAPEQIDSIFQLFMQAEAGMSAGTESGLGIGLTLARSLAEMHGGTIQASSPGVGRGSTFTVRLPMASHAAAPAQAQAPQDDATGDLRVLVIDDNRDSADSATDVLRLLGNRVESAYDGESGVAVAQRFRPHMVLLDLAMPGMDGFEARRRLRDDGAAQAFLVAMTGFGNEEDKRRTRAAGFDAHLTKPVELDALVSLLNEARNRAGIAAPPAT